MNEGDRIQLISMGSDDPDPILPGSLGTITSILQMAGDETHVEVEWDNGRHLGCVLPHDQINVMGGDTCQG